MDPRQLREETRGEHESTEALMPLASPTLDRSTYVRTLEILFPLMASWEAWASSHAPQELGALLAARRRSHLLAADLRSFGRDTAQAGACEVDWDLVVNEGKAAAQRETWKAGLLGAMYVMEGSTLGGQLIARHVETVLGLEPGQGNEYFRGHEKNTGTLWREFLLEITALPEEEASATIGAARRTFQTFGQHLRSGYAFRAQA